MTRIYDLIFVLRQKRQVKHIAATGSLCTLKLFAAHVEKRCFIGNRSNSWFNLASALIFSVISWRKFQIWWFFLNASAGHWKCCGGPHVAHGLLIAHRCHIRSLSGSYTVVCLRKSSEALALGPPFQGPLKVFHA